MDIYNVYIGAFIGGVILVVISLLFFLNWLITPKGKATVSAKIAKWSFTLSILAGITALGLGLYLDANSPEA